MVLTNPVRRVAVIGAGSSGLAANRYLLAERYFEKIDVYEQQSSVGGVWNYTPRSLKVGMSTTVPHLNPHEPVQEPIWTNQPEGTSELNFVSPLYAEPETNIPKDLMRYSDQPFPEEAQLFPKHHTTSSNLIQQVKDVKLKNPELSTCDLTTRNLHTGTETTSMYDAVVVASGHFAVPYIPEISGIEAWDRPYPKAISHSKFYDSAEEFRSKKVIVVGSSASGLDIGAQINQSSKGKVIVSQKSESYLAALVPSDKIIHSEIVSFLTPSEYDRAVQFADGHIEKEVDAIVFCTGYFYSFPFLESIKPSFITHGWRTMNVYQQLIFIDHPTLAFPMLSQRVIPFPMAENQASVFSRVWSGRIHLPEHRVMREAEAREISQKGEGKAFHVLPFPMDADYLNHLYNWAATAEARPGLINDGKGKLGTCWGDREHWMQALFPDIRWAFVQKEDQRSEIKTLTALGFDFGSWKKEQEEQW
ncbi:uncharacterized protein N7483_000933 [Penicillium malachiteum]|uniref:uncharacterized protein n=1 Tax=Penicillium malachiteum TaxID=1324776 RepID=UPI002546B398|nr:uncharacterized protein N7483_000933 [Penicillium malachiteum]KAJ5735808.1 hypothetical protein N7483_000933 [Penicillium malachiteum]